MSRSTHHPVYSYNIYTKYQSIIYYVYILYGVIYKPISMESILAYIIILYVCTLYNVRKFSGKYKKDEVVSTIILIYGIYVFMLDKMNQNHIQSIFATV